MSNFFQDLTHQKSLKSVNLWWSYLKNKKVVIFWHTVYTGFNRCNCSVLGVVSTGWGGKPPWCVSSHWGQLVLTLYQWVPLKAGEYTEKPPATLALFSQGWVGAWLRAVEWISLLPCGFICFAEKSTFYNIVCTCIKCCMACILVTLNYYGKMPLWDNQP